MKDLARLRLFAGAKAACRVATAPVVVNIRTPTYILPQSNQGVLPMSGRNNRRQFLQSTAAVGIGYWVAGGVQAAESKSPNGRIAMASIGIGGKGSSDAANAAKLGNMVAICDVDEKRLDDAAKKYPRAEKFTDFRKMLDVMGKQHRRGDREHPRPYARPRGAHGHAAGQALLLPEAARPHNL